ncbi:hypothetical protein CF319_g8599 [Tilletia indica]|nr:hypothetical protein CF319_g8599 [Tilletia indica]
MSSALDVLIPPLRFSVIAATGPSQFHDGTTIKKQGEDGDGAAAGRHADLSKAERRRKAQLSETIYRGTYPKPRNTPFLSRLYLRTILSLTPKPPADIGFGPPSKKDTHRPPSDHNNNALKAWADAQGIRLVHIQVPSIKDRSPTALPAEDAHRMLSIITDRANLPLYMHCLDGVEITALCTALFRKTQRWHPRPILEEYCRHLRDPTPTAPSDIAQYIDRFEVGPIAQASDEEDDDEEEDEDDEEEEEEDDEEEDDALEALDLEGY